MSADRRRQAEELFQAAVDLRVEQRAEFIEERCGSDAALLADVEALLSAYESDTGGFLGEPAIRWLEPTQIGSYEVQGEIGRGGMGVVYLGRDARLSRDVAIKAVPPHVSGNAELLSRLDREAKTLASLNHPNIATIYSLEETGSKHYLILEYVAGDTLEERLRTGAMPLDTVLTVCRQIAEAIEAAHENGVIHRDLKPANVKIRPDGHVKLLDFGIAKGFASDTSDGDRDAPAVAGETTRGAVVGTPGYMSPEQARGDEEDKRVDIWAFGCVLYECLAGCPAFPGETDNDAIEAVLTAEPAWDRLPPETPRRILDLLRHCLKRDPRDRLRDIGDARIEIEEALGKRPTLVSGLRPAVAPNNLPAQVTSFVGRKEELATLKELLAQTRLLTITGSGGCGKTRLALQIAREAVSLGEYPEGVWFVELAALAEPSLVPQSVATALGVKEQPGEALRDTLMNHLQAKVVLLIIDNCEHLLAACAELADALLRGAPNLRIMASSREGLGTAGETTFHVPSLSVPPFSLGRRGGDEGEPLSAAELFNYEAAQLFAERARAAKPTFEIADDNAESIAQICRRLDGIPLAIELAAARVRAVSVEQIANRLDDSFRILTGGSRTVLPRQQTLRAAIDWSYNLLSRTERTLLCRLSVFAGGWTLAASERICSDDTGPGAPRSPRLEESQILDLIASLVNKSLVVYEGTPYREDRYRLLETVRQYVREELTRSDEGELVRSRHLDFFVALAGEAEPELIGRNQATWFDRLETEHENLRAALQWNSSAEGGPQKGLRLATLLGWFWHVRGHFGLGRSVLDEVLAREGAADPTLARAGALDMAGALARGQSDYVAARVLSEEALAIRRKLNDKQGTAWSLYNLGIAATFQGDYGAARKIQEESLAIGRELDHKGILSGAALNLGALVLLQGDLGSARVCLEEALTVCRERRDTRATAWALYGLAYVSREEGDYATARRLQEESLALRRDIGEKRGIGHSLCHLGRIAVNEGNLAEARNYLGEGIVLLRDIGDTAWLLAGLHSAGELAVAEGEHARAARLLAAVEALSGATDAPRTAGDRTEHDVVVQTIRAAQGQEAFETAWTEGCTLSFERAAEDALRWLIAEREEAIDKE